MSVNHIPVQFSDRKRRAVDRLTRRLVTSCGIAILLLMLLLFCWLIGVVLPLFSAPGVSARTARRGLFRWMDNRRNRRWRYRRHRNRWCAVPTARRCC